MLLLLNPAVLLPENYEGVNISYESYGVRVNPDPWVAWGRDLSSYSLSSSGKSCHSRLLGGVTRFSTGRSIALNCGVKS